MTSCTRSLASSLASSLATCVLALPAAAIGLVLGVQYLVPLAAAVISNVPISRHLQQIGPLPAGPRRMAR